LIDQITIETNETVKSIHAATQNTVAGVDDLRNQVDELLRRQQSLQDTLDAISGKNGLFQFVVEMLNSESFLRSFPLFSGGATKPDYS
jgi:hypothetical protein